MGLVQDLKDVTQCVLLGVKDSILGMWPVLQLVRRNEKIRKQVLQCFLLNGVILGLSIFIFDYVLLPMIQWVAGFLYSVISNPTESGILPWLGTIVSYIFTGFWVLPVFWISKPINNIWFQDIASVAFEELKKQQSKVKKTKSPPSEKQSLSQTISRFIADLLFSIVMEMLFLIQFASKITQEYQLPIVTQKLSTTNECVVSALSGIHSTAQHLCGFLESNYEVFAAALEQNAPNSENKQQPTHSSIVQTLRTRATGYIHSLQKECPPSVPYTLAVYNAQSLSSSSESKHTLMKQVTANHEKLSKIEQEKEQLVLDLQLIKMKYEKEQKKVGALEAALAQHRGLSTATSPAVPLQPRGESLVGSLSTLSAGENNEGDAVDDTVMIRNHFVGRISELSTQVQGADGKAAHYYAGMILVGLIFCRALHKQLNHNLSLKTKLAQELQTAEETMQELQDQLATTSSSYEKQLSTMSDHLCELNDRLLKQSDEIEVLRKSSKGKRWGK